MTTELGLYREAYASLVVAVYEPLILEWISKTFVKEVAYAAALRGSVQRASGQAATAAQPMTAAPPTTRARTRARGAAAGAAGAGDAGAPTIAPAPGGITTLGGAAGTGGTGGGAGRAPETTRPEYFAVRGGQAHGTLLRSAGVDGQPGGHVLGDSYYPFGVVAYEGSPENLVDRGDGRTPDPETLAVDFAPNLILRGTGLDLDQNIPKLTDDLMKGFEKLNTLPPSEARKYILDLYTKNKLVDSANTYDILYLPGPDVLKELLSPIGLSHFYRQLYFNLDEGVGPIEEAFTIAPLETFEVVYETTRRQIHDEQVELGVEESTEASSESRNLEEVSDKVSSMLQRDLSASISTQVSYSTPVFQAAVAGSLDYASSSQRSREETSRRLKETTKRASERITKTFSLRVRTVDELLTTATTRRTIENHSSAPVSYGLRRVLRRVRVKVQDLGPRFVWQTYVREPGAGLAQSRFVQFAAAGDVSVPETVPGTPPKPQGGTESGSTVCVVAFRGSPQTIASAAPEASDFSGQAYIKLRIPAGKMRNVKGVNVESMSDVGDPNPNTDRGEPAPVKYHTPSVDDNGTYIVEIDILAADSFTVNVGYTYDWEPSDQSLKEWEEIRKAKKADYEKIANQDAFDKAFERSKTVITEKSRIAPRPAADLRREERYELMNRVVTQLFATPARSADPTPLEIETVNRFFDVEAMFAYPHASWWRPRYTRTGPVKRPNEYEITADSDPARLGSSLGWTMQLDGDMRRNSFLNSPWARVCIPIRPGRERRAVEWLAQHVEGEQGYDITSASSPLKKLLEDVEAFRASEASLGVDGPDYVAVDEGAAALVGHGALQPEDVYPVIDTFEVTVPTDGFVYDEILIVGN